MRSEINGAIRLEGDRCRDLRASSALEWVETNGVGSYACGTVAGVHTRRYHGLLVAALQPPVGRTLTLSHLEECVSVGGVRHELTTNAYKAETIYPEGYKLLAGFALEPWPTWTFDLGGGASLVREVIMLDGRQGVVVRYRHGARVAAAGTVAAPPRVTLRPLMTWRDYHDIVPRSDDRAFAITRDAADGRAWRIGAPASGGGAAARELVVRSTVPLRLDPESWWYYHFSYAIELERGDPKWEDKHSPGAWTAEIPAGGSFAVWFGLEEPGAGALEDAIAAERRRRAALNVPTRPDSALGAVLARAADQFIVRRGAGLTSILAGHPWFTDWGRDTMISLPGLTFHTGRLADAGRTLQTFARAVDQGMIPNHFPDSGEEPHYNTVDATLWFFEAAARYLRAGGDRALFDAELWPAFVAIIGWHERGTRYGIGVDPADGLLRAGNAETQLTWMDARYEGVAFTPRHGKAVEINALWVNALRLAAHWAEERSEGKFSEHATALADRATASFNAKFWNARAQCLYDVIESAAPDDRDGAIRPNQVFAVSLPCTPLDEKRFAAVLGVVERDLLTPYGLRSLAPGSPGYDGQYLGDRRTRDERYHNGTVWGWLVGPYLSAVIRTRGDSEETRAAVRGYLAPLLRHLREEACLGQISEIFDADAPHAPRGCFAQAWSIAELLRVLVEHDLLSEEM